MNRVEIQIRQDFGSTSQHLCPSSAIANGLVPNADLRHRHIPGVDIRFLLDHKGVKSTADHGLQLIAENFAVGADFTLETKTFPQKTRMGHGTAIPKGPEFKDDKIKMLQVELDLDKAHARKAKKLLGNLETALPELYSMYRDSGVVLRRAFKKKLELKTDLTEFISPTSMMR